MLIQDLFTFQLEQSKGKHADHEKAIENFLQAHSIASAK